MEANFDFMRRLIDAAHQYKNGTADRGQKLEAFGATIDAVAKFLTATNAPAEVRQLLTGMLAEFKNLVDGRPTVFVGPGISGDVKPAQSEMIWAFASVYIGTFDDKKKRREASVEVEDSLTKAGLPLPSSGRRRAKNKGDSILNWGRLRRSTRRTRDIDGYFHEAETLFERMLAAGDTPDQARQYLLAAAIEAGVS